MSRVFHIIICIRVVIWWLPSKVYMKTSFLIFIWLIQSYLFTSISIKHRKFLEKLVKIVSTKPGKKITTLLSFNYLHWEDVLSKLTTFAAQRKILELEKSDILLFFLPFLIIIKHVTWILIWLVIYLNFKHLKKKIT